MILEFRLHRGKMRIPVPGQKVHVSVKRPPREIDSIYDLDNEVDEIPKSVHRHCVDCDKVGKGIFIVPCHCF